MNFPYIRVFDFPNHIKRQRILPWIRFGAFNPSKSPSSLVYPVGLVDSGSELSFINHEIGEQLGYDIKTGKEIEIVGVGGAKIKAYLHKVGIQVGEVGNSPIVFEGIFGFTYEPFPSSMPQQTAILGTLGFFEKLNVFFDYPNFISIVEKPSRKLN